MRAAAILGLGCSSKDLKPFQSDTTIEWRIGMPAARDEADVILVFGGDGTIHRHLGHLVKLELPVLVVPAGSGNDFARSLNLRSLNESQQAWDKFRNISTNVRQIDLGVISTVESGSQAITPLAQWYFCCVAGVGLDSEVARRANNLPRWLRGHGGYVVSLLPRIFTFAPLPMKISARESASASWTVRSAQPTILAAFANSPLYGGGMKIAPQAKMDDGLLDVCIVGGVNPFKLFCMFPTVYAGRHLSIREVQYFQTERVRVETEYPVDVYADGEYVCRTPVEVSLQQAALSVVTP